MNALRSFLAWPAGASLLYLLSAACLLGGAALVLAPGAGDEARAVERFTALGTVAAYVAAIAGLAALVCRWKPGNGDAVALLVLLALFLPGMHAGLGTIASHFPLATLALGAGGLALAFGAGHQVQRRVTGAWGWRLMVPLALLTAWNALAPGLIGLAYRNDVRPETLLGVWLPGWWLVLAGGAWLAFTAHRAAPSESGPVVGSGGLRWILTAIAVLATGLHQWALGYAFDLGLGAWDLLGVVIALALLLDVLARRWDLLPSGMLAGGEAILGIGCSLAALSGDFAAAPISPLWLACYPPVLLGVGGLALLVIAWRFSEVRTAIAAGAWLLGCIASWGITAEQPHANWRALAIAVYLLAAFVVCLAKEAPRTLAMASAALVVIATLAHGGPLTMSVCTLAFAVRGVRARSRRAALPGAIPVVVQGIPLLPKLFALLAAAGGWLGVGAAFALLATGAWVSWRRAQPASPGFTAEKAT